MTTTESPQQLASLTIEQALQQALAHHQAGQLQDAERLYRAILQAQPNHPDANHNLGVLAVQVQQPAAGLPHFKAALEANPNVEQYWLSYIDALIQTDQTDLARDLLEQGLQRGVQEAATSKFAETFNGLGNALLALGQLDNAVASYRRALELKPDFAEAFSNLGSALLAFGQLNDSVANCRQALAIKPDFADAHYNLGNALQISGQFDNAVASYRRTLELRPDYAEAHCNLGHALQALGQLDNALASYRRALELKPNFVKAHCNLGNALQALGQLDNAVACFRRALEIKPNFPDGRMNLGNALHEIVGKTSGQVLRNTSSQQFQGVRKQYESLPFPPRDPEAERYVLRVSLPDILGKINQYCFRGERDFSKTFRVLVAGCGTGDSAIWLAFQLKDTPAEIVGIDISKASLEVAKERAKVRNLANIRWINGSLLDVSSLGLGKFDYITCLGVLHHLPSPADGLAALESVLADGGAMAIMLYGAVARSHIYIMQDILRRLSIGLHEPGKRLAFAKKIVANLPATNGFRIREGMQAIQRQYLQDDTNFWDTLLHEQDQSYTASQIREFLASAGLFLQSFISYQGVGAITSLQYDLNLYIDDASQNERLRTLSGAEREDLAEVLDGSLALHTVYATRSPQASLNPAAPNAILSPMSHYSQQIIAHLGMPDQELSIILSNGIELPYRPSIVTRAFLSKIDGHRSNADIANLLGVREGSEELDRINQELVIPNALHWVIARTSAGSYFPPLGYSGNLTFPLRHCEPVALPY